MDNSFQEVQLFPAFSGTGSLHIPSPGDFGPLVAGYSTGILFGNISPVPQGIGVVEGVMALVCSSLGIHVVIATLIVLTFRDLNF